MNILLVTAYFPPEIGSASHLFYELGTEFLRLGHRVTALTGFPRYNIDVAKLPARYRGPRLWMREEMNGMTVVRARTLGMPRDVPVLRGLDQVTSSFASLFSGLFLVPGDFDVMLIYSPPLFLGLTGLALRMFGKGKAVLNIQDLFPQSAIDLGVLRNRALIALFEAVESHLYRSADLVTVHSKGNRDHVLSSGGDPSRTLIVHNPVDVRLITPGPRLNGFRSRQGIADDAFVVSFGGVIGYSQDVDTIIEAARLLSDDGKILFYIVGDGVEKPRLVAKASGLPNVRFLPMVAREEYTTLLHASDLCLVTLHPEVKTPVVPSKILSIMAAGRPMVVGVPLDGDAPGIVREAGCGVCVPPGDPDGMAKAIRRMSGDGQFAAECGRKGRDYVERHFSLERCAGDYIGIFRTLIGVKENHG